MRERKSHDQSLTYCSTIAVPVAKCSVETVQASTPPSLSLASRERSGYVSPAMMTSTSKFWNSFVFATSIYISSVQAIFRILLWSTL